MDKKVSVILLPHNRPDTFMQAFNSYMEQDYTNKELIIIKTACTVEYPEIKGQGIKVIDVVDNIYQNITPYIHYCDGEIVTLLHDDDMFYDSESLRRRVNPFNMDNDVQVVFTSWVTMDKDGNTSSGIRDCNNVSLKALLMKEYIYYPTMAWSKDITEYIDPWDKDFKVWGDWWFKVQCLFQCNCKPVHEPTLRYRQHEGQVSFKSGRDGVNEAEKVIYKRKVRELIGSCL